MIDLLTNLNKSALPLKNNITHFPKILSSIEDLTIDQVIYLLRIARIFKTNPRIAERCLI